MLNRMIVLLLGLAGLLIASCSSNRKAFYPDRKFAPAKLQKDFTLFRNILEESHPSLYWFTPKDSMDQYFDHGFQQLKDSMTEPAFRNLLSAITSKIRCGHTSMRYSKRYTAWLDTATLRMFPFTVKVWGPDSMAVTAMLNRKDSLLKRGTVITAIDGRNVSTIIDTFTNYLQSDGLIITGKYQMMSNRNSFGNLYRAVYGIPEKVSAKYIDSNGLPQSAMIAAFEPHQLLRTKKDRKRTLQRARPLRAHLLPNLRRTFPNP